MRTLLLIAAMLPLAGCAELSLFAWTNRPDYIEPDQRHPVTEVLCLWEQGEGQGLDGLPSRGFAGQVFFFTKGRAEPAKVTGDVTVYVFDDYGTIEEQRHPFHQFNFEAAAWNTFLVDAKLGPAYQLFLPYTRKGAHAASCSLRIKYTPADGGPPVFSRMATVALPGRRRPPVSNAEATPAAAAPEPAVTVNASPATGGVDLQGLKAELARLRETARATVTSTSLSVAEFEEPLPDEVSTIETVGRYRLTP